MTLLIGLIVSAISTAIGVEATKGGARGLRRLSAVRVPALAVLIVIGLIGFGLVEAVLTPGV